MNQAHASPKLIAFDATRYLTDDEAIAEYRRAVLEADDPKLLQLALRDIARVQGMSQNLKGTRGTEALRHES